MQKVFVPYDKSNVGGGGGGDDNEHPDEGKIYCPEKNMNATWMYINMYICMHINS